MRSAFGLLLALGMLMSCFPQSADQKQACSPVGKSEPCFDAHSKHQGVGLCKVGNRTCLPNQTWSRCTGQVLPTPERCNGQDDNCNGKIDEDWPLLGKACKVGRGACECKGKWRCKADGAGLQCCTPKKPSAERCDAIDRDCDGDPITAKGKALQRQSERKTLPGFRGPVPPCIAQCQRLGNAFVWKPILAVSKEDCNGKDDDCNGKVDDGIAPREGQWPLHVPRSQRQKPCYPSKQICKQGGWLKTPGKFPTAEVCNGQDDDCDGQTDEGLTPETRWPGCPFKHPRKSPCQPQIRTCIQGGMEKTQTVICPTAEVCNSKDDDCDGKTDEGWSDKLGKACTVGRGICTRHGHTICDTKNPKGPVVCNKKPGLPKAKEICDFKLDHNCNGKTDKQDGCKCKNGDTLKLYPNPKKGSPPPKGCKAQGKDFECEGTCKAGTKKCIEGEWGGKKGLWENPPQYPQKEICDTQDNDCDGDIDEGFKLKTPCSVGKGVCLRKGRLICDPKDPKRAICSAKAARPKFPGPEFPERCNGDDDNCNGATDEGCECKTGATRPFYAQKSGCSKKVAKKDYNCTPPCKAGTQKCIKGLWGGKKRIWQVRPQYPQKEICDGKDNNCSGKADDVPDLGKSCSAGLGICKTKGTLKCDLSKKKLICSAKADMSKKIKGPEFPERCNGDDDNCNGATDEGCDCVSGATRRHYNAEKGCTPIQGNNFQCKGHCDYGLQRCTLGRWKGWIKKPRLPKEELCNGKDDSCSGKPDAGFGIGKTCFVGTGPCRVSGKRICHPTDKRKWICNKKPDLTKKKAKETCNGVDDNCNGAVDEGLGTSCKWATGLVAGYLHTCALLPDYKTKSKARKIACWGSNLFGQLHGDEKQRSTPTYVHRSLGDVRQLSTHVSHSCALVGPSRRLLCWGNNALGQLGTDGKAHSRPVAPKKLARVAIRQVVASLFYTCALGSQKLWCWGHNPFGQLGTGDRTSQPSPAPVKLPSGIRAGDIQTIQSRNYHICALAKGQVYCWGFNRYRQLGSSSTKDGLLPQRVALSQRATHLAVGTHHTCAILQDKSMWCWGDNAFGQLGVGHFKAVKGPTRVKGLSGVLGLTAGSRHTCAHTARALYCWGSNAYGQGGYRQKESPSPLPAATRQKAQDIASIQASTAHTCLLRTDGRAYCWGNNELGQLGHDRLHRRQHVPSQVKRPKEKSE